MLVYIHVPFCRSKCRYCSFYSLALPEEDGSGALSGYLAALSRELFLWGQRLGRVRVETVFFGGGTPSLLPEKAVSGILEQVAGVFSLAPDAEISLEANPESALIPGRLCGARAAGVNRLSLGVQGMDDRTLSLLGRVHTAADIPAAVEAARAARFSSVSLDLMWGLPGLPDDRQAAAGFRHTPQKREQWLHCLEQAVSLGPDHISAYGLTLEPGSLLGDLHASGGLALPEDEEQAAMFLEGAAFLEAQGYGQYEISNFARPGFACRHNLGYWAGTDYLGFGPAAVSTLGGIRLTNQADLAGWMRSVQAHTPETLLPPEGALETCGTVGERLSAATLLREFLMLSLRTAKGLSLEQWEKRSGLLFSSQFGSLAQALRHNGLAVLREGYFALTREGMLVSNSILERFFSEMDTLT